MQDPQPVINWYRACSFVIAIASGLALVQVIPQEIKDWLPVVTLIVSGALTIFFGTSANAAINPSVARRVVDKVSDGGQK